MPNESVDLPKHLSLKGRKYIVLDAEAEKAFKKEQSDWLKDEVTRERAIVKAQADLDNLNTKVAAKSNALDGLEDTILGKTALLELLNKKFQHDTDRLSGLGDSIDHRKEELESLDALIAAKRAEVDDNLKNYSESRQKASDEVISTLDEQVTAKQKELASLSESLELTRSSIATVLQTANDEVAESALLITTNSKTAEEQQVELAKLKSELVTTETSLKKALYERDEASSLADKARIQNEQFVQYEQNARKVLDNKDRELQDLAAKLSNDNQLLENRRSFLPRL